MAKSGKAFRTIGEVETLLNIQQHTLRYWESQIAHIQPIRRGGRSRLYRPDDLQLIAGIKKLILEDGLTIRAVQKTLKEKGVSYVSGLNPVNLDNPIPMPDSLITGAMALKKNVSDGSSSSAAARQAAAFRSSGKKNSSGGADAGDRDSLSQVYARLDRLRQRMETTARSM